MIVWGRSGNSISSPTVQDFHVGLLVQAVNVSLLVEVHCRGVFRFLLRVSGYHIGVVFVSRKVLH